MPKPIFTPASVASFSAVEIAAVFNAIWQKQQEMERHFDELYEVIEYSERVEHCIKEWARRRTSGHD